MLNQTIVKQSLSFSALAVLYVAVVATIMQHAETLFGPDGKSLLAPITFLLLLVVSAATMGMLIFGKPVMLYLDGKKSDALSMVMCTIGCLAMFTAVLLVSVAIANT